MAADRRSKCLKAGRSGQLIGKSTVLYRNKSPFPPSFGYMSFYGYTVIRQSDKSIATVEDGDFLDG
jgi:hypothetical protein